MIVRVMNEAGYNEAMLGLSLSFNKEITPKVARKLYSRGDEESKFLRQMMVWLDVTAPWRWWKQMAEYRIGMEWNIESQSSSTMHTVMRRHLAQGDFDCDVPDDYLQAINDLIDVKDFDGVTSYLPGSYLYRRILTTNYQTLRRIVGQRHLHRLKDWRYFIKEIMDQLRHQEFLVDVRTEFDASLASGGE